MILGLADTPRTHTHTHTHTHVEDLASNVLTSTDGQWVSRFPVGASFKQRTLPQESTSTRSPVKLLQPVPQRREEEIAMSGYTTSSSLILVFAVTAVTMLVYTCTLTWGWQQCQRVVCPCGVSQLLSFSLCSLTALPEEHMYLTSGTCMSTMGPFHKQVYT